MADYNKPTLKKQVQKILEQAPARNHTESEFRAATMSNSLAAGYFRIMRTEIDAARNDQAAWDALQHLDKKIRENGIKPPAELTDWLHSVGRSECPRPSGKTKGAKWGYYHTLAVAVLWIQYNRRNWSLRACFKFVSRIAAKSPQTVEGAWRKSFLPSLIERHGVDAVTDWLIPN